jgi:hypothetical protein
VAARKHEDMLAQGAREAPEPETAEERSKRLGIGTAAGGAVAGGAALVKFAGLWKVVLWLVAWHGVVDAWRIGGWIAIGLLAATVAVFVAIGVRKEG